MECQLAPHATLWAHSPDITASLQFFCARAKLALTVVATAEALLDATAQAQPGDFLVIDCATATDALERCLAIVTRTAVLIYICHPDKEFVDDLKCMTRGALHWLPPAYTGLSILNRLRVLAATPPPIPVAEQVLLHSPLTTREQQVRRLVAEGCANREIAARLGITSRTVKNHVANGKAKLGLRTRAEYGATYRGSVGGLGRELDLLPRLNATEVRSGR